MLAKLPDAMSLDECIFTIRDSVICKVLYDIKEL